MARSYYYNDSKLNQYIQPRIKKYYNYTHQKLVEEEINIKNKIEQYSARIKKLNETQSEYLKLEKNYIKKKEEIEEKLKNEEIREKFKISKRKGIEAPKKPETNSKIINLFSFIISIPTCYGVGEEDYWFLFIPVATIVYAIIFNLIFGNDSDYNEYLNQKDKFNKELDKYFKPSKEYLKNKELINNINNELLDFPDIQKKLYEEERSKKFEIVLLKKILFEFKRFKKRANERERTAKINAFESKARSGAQNIKEKLLKAVRIKSKWLCPYCNSSNEIKTAEADHIHPVNKGGMTTMQNMVLICKKCNSKKTNLMLRVFCKKQGFNYNEVCERLERLGKDV